MICFQISIFEPLETTDMFGEQSDQRLWFAFKLVSLNHWKQPLLKRYMVKVVVICFQISIFEPLETTYDGACSLTSMLWFAFKLVSLNHWKQQVLVHCHPNTVVICFQISIFEPLETTSPASCPRHGWLWFAFKLVSLNHWKQLLSFSAWICFRCDLLSN